MKPIVAGLEPRIQNVLLGSSLFAQVLSLILVSLVAVQVVAIGIIFNLPPPVPEVYRVSDVVQALHGKTVTPHDEAPLIVTKIARPPVAAFVGRYTREALVELSRALGVDQSKVVAGDYPSPRFRFPNVHDAAAHQRWLRIGMTHDIFVSPFKVAVQQPDGSWLLVRPKPSFPTPWQRIILLWFVISAVALAPFAYLLARRLAAPISAFAAAAERLGRDPNAPPLTLRGPAEVGRAVRAFNEMQDRLRRYVDDRTAMVGAVAHDMRTPLTRLRFRIESIPEPLRLKMAADIDQMDAMVSATLAFVRDATQPAGRHRLELVSLVQSIADEMAETGLDVSAEINTPVVIEGDPVALRRLVTNLIDNALKFGARARARVYCENGAAVIEVDDDGPGIPEGEREQVFEPFRRGERSRSRETGGAGLGLAVVRSVARAHGGDAELSNRHDGGLRARAHFPL
jgi:signal transduction histidine kinase